jgi:hypothetical protein
MAGIENPSFTEVFGLREPTPEETNDVFSALSHTFKEMGQPVATIALFSVPELETEVMAMIVEIGHSYADSTGIEPKVAGEIVYGGVIAAIELLGRLNMALRD